MSKFIIAYVLTYVSCLAASFIIDVSWGIYFYQLNYFLNPEARWWASMLPDLRFSFIIAACILIAFIFQNKKYSENKVFQVPQTKWLLMDYILYALISLWAVWPEMHSETLRTHTKLLAFLFISYKVIDTPKKFERLIWTFLFGNFYLTWIAYSTGRTGQGRLDGIGPSDAPDGNAVSAILISAIPILLYYVIKGKKWERGLAAIFLLFITNGIVLINSRGAFVGLIVACAYIGVHLFFDKGMKTIHKIGLIVVGIIGIGAFAYLADPLYWERMHTIIEEAGSETGGGGRKFFWMKTFEMVKEHPFGLGTWGYQFLSPQFIPEEMLTEGRRAVHSLYFQCLAERGYVGFLIFTGLLLSGFRFLRKTRRYLRQKGEMSLVYQCMAIEAGYVAFLTACVFLSQLHAEILYWFQLFIACFGNIYMLKNYGTEKTGVASETKNSINL